MDQGIGSPEHKAGSARAAPGLSRRQGRPALGAGQGRGLESPGPPPVAIGAADWRLHPEALPRATARHPLADPWATGHATGMELTLRGASGETVWPRPGQ